MGYDYDLIIVGAGPAGSTLARLLPRRLRVLVLDGQALSRPKPCGGLLAPDAQQALARFRLTLPKDILVDPQIFAVKTIDLRAGRVRYYPRCYLNLDRSKFDSWLASLIPASIPVLPARLLRIERQEGGFLLTWREGDGTIVSRASRYAVGADGACSPVRRGLFPEVKMTSYTAIQQWFPAAGMNPFYSCVFDPDTSESCSWSIFKDDHFIFGGAFAPAGCREAFERQKERLAPFGFIFDQPVKTEACTVLRPRSWRDFPLGGEGAFLVGEAAGLISPSSLEGISSAMLSGSWLAQAFSAHEEGKAILARYQGLCRGLRLKLSAKRIKRWVMYTPSLRRMVMASGLQSIDLALPESNCQP